MQSPANPYADFLKTWGGLAGVVSLFISIAMLSRGWYRDRSHLWFILKTDETERFFVRTIQSKIPNAAIGTATLVVSNNSSRPNAILEWNVTTTDKEGKVRKVDMPHSESTNLGTFNAIPTTVAAFTAVEAHLMFLVDVRTLPDPVVFHVRAKDRTKKVHRISVSIPNVLKNTLSGE